MALKVRTLCLLLVLLVLVFTPLFAQNTELQLMQNELFQAQLAVKDAKASRWPTLELSISGSWMQNPPLGPITLSSDQISSLVGFPAPAVPSYVTVYDGMEATLYDFGLTFTQPIFTWGKIDAAVKASEAVARAQEYSLMNRQSELQREAATRLVTLYELTSIKDLLQKQQVLKKELSTLMEKSVASGILLDLAKAETESNLLDIEIAMLDTVYAMKTQELELKKLGEELTQTPAFFNEEEIRQLLAIGLDELLDFALNPQRYALAALSSLQKASEEAVKLAKGSLYGKPDFALVVSLGYKGPRFPIFEKDWYGQNDYSFSVSVGMKTMLFDGGKQYNAVKRAEKQKSSADLETRSATETIEIQVRKEYLLLSTLMDKLQLQNQKISTLTRRVSVNTTLFESGYASKEQCIEAEMHLNSAIIEKHRLSIEAWQAYQKLRHICSV